jgi:hypothetical protein
MIGRLLLVLSMAGSTALAAPTITSVTPNSGPLTGGTHVIIKGTGFSNICIFCLPQFPAPSVAFGSALATNVKFIDSTMLEVVTPSSLPITVSVTVTNLDGTGFAEAQNAFTFLGDMNEGFEPLLFPIFTRPVFGAFGSEFRTFARASQIGLPTVLFGLDQRCLQVFPPLDPTVPVAVDIDTALPADCASGTGRVFWMKKGTGSAVAFNLRVADVSRAASSLGTEIPVVRADEFSIGGVALVGIPSDPRFRITLRIYSLDHVDGPLRLFGEGLNRQVHLSTPDDIFEPAYLEVHDLPPLLTRLVILAPENVRIWAFITVTNNDTQQITTVTPQ